MKQTSHDYAKKMLQAMQDEFFKADSLPLCSLCKSKIERCDICVAQMSRILIETFSACVELVRHLDLIKHQISFGIIGQQMLHEIARRALGKKPNKEAEESLAKAEEALPRIKKELTDCWKTAMTSDSFWN